MISIAIPTYEMGNLGVEFLRISLNKITEQSYKNIEVVISDHSKNSDIKNLCDTFSTNLKIKYFNYSKNYGNSSANLNNALKNCDGTLIKFLMQDEFLCDSFALEKIKNSFENNTINWLLTGCLYGKNMNTILGKMLPKYSNDIIKGINSIGSPSVLTIRNENIEFFNENFIWVMDCDYYKKLYDKFNKPFIINEYLVFITQHENQLSVLLNDEQKNNEVSELIKKYESN